MTASQYKNIIKWTLFLERDLSKSESIDVAKRILKNLGAAFPHGDYSRVLDALNTQKYLGWRSCKREDVQKYANVGIASIGIDNNKIIIILPNHEVNDLAAFDGFDCINNSYVKHSTELDREEHDNMRFFVYSYGYKF